VPLAVVRLLNDVGAYWTVQYPDIKKLYSWILPFSATYVEMTKLPPAEGHSVRCVRLDAVKLGVEPVPPPGRVFFEIIFVCEMPAPVPVVVCGTVFERLLIAGTMLDSANLPVRVCGTGTGSDCVKLVVVVGTICDCVKRPVVVVGTVCDGMNVCPPGGVAVVGVKSENLAGGWFESMVARLAREAAQ
jgi:hypothetical protein